MNHLKPIRTILLCTMVAFTAAMGCSPRSDTQSPLPALAMAATQGTNIGGARIGVNAAELNMSDVSRIELTVTGTGIPTPIVQELVRAGDVFQGVLLEIPVGTDRIFTARAYNSADTEIFQGELKDVEIKTDEVTLVALTLQSTTPAPIFGNAAPVISGVTVSAASVQPGESVKIEAVATDADGDALTFTWSAPKGSFDAANAAETNWTAPSETGFHKITLNVSDVHGATVSLSLNLEVAVGPAGHADVTVGVNSAPVITNILADPTRLGPGDSLNLTAFVSDPDGDSLSFVWSSSCDGAFHNRNLQNTGFDVDDGAAPGSCTLTLTVSDGKGGVNTGSLTIHIVKDASQNNNPPLLFDAFQQSQSVKAGQTLVFRVRGRDPEGKALTFAWNAPEGSLGNSVETPHSPDATQSEVVWTAPACGSNIKLMVKATDADNFATTYTYLPVSVTGASACTQENPIRVSVHTDGTQSDQENRALSTSADGRYVAFDSIATNLVDGDINGMKDIFLHDRITGETTLISRATDGSQTNNNSRVPTISADGRYVTYTSQADNLVANDGNNAEDVFIYDRANETTELVSLSNNGVQGDKDSRFSSVSADGRYVAFESFASNLVNTVSVSGDSLQIYRRDRLEQKTILVSVALNNETPEEASLDPRISEDGQVISFSTFASNLVSGDTNQAVDAFVRDIQSGITSRVSVNSAGDQGNDVSMATAISGNGQFVVLASEASNLVANDTNGKSDVFIYDRLTKETKRISVGNQGQQNNDHCMWGQLSFDGRYASMFCMSSSVLEGGNTSFWQTYVRDQQTGLIKLVSRAQDGSEGNGNSPGYISADGRFVYTSSEANNLVAGDTNNVSDIFLYSLPAN